LIEAVSIIHWEDFKTGEATQFGRREVLSEDATRFGLEFDPHPVHLDETLASRMVTKGLVSSDWHSCAMLMRMLCDDYLYRTAGAGAPGLEHVKWFNWVRPGDILHAQRIPLSMRPSRSRPRIGIVRMLIDVFNQRDELVLSWLPVQLVDRRYPDDPFPSEKTTSEIMNNHSSIRLPPGELRGGIEAFDLDERKAEVTYISEDWGELGRYRFTKDDMLSFATRYNPQYFHADEERASLSLYGGLIASGWHNASIWNRLKVQRAMAQCLLDERLEVVGSSVAVLNMKWPMPVRPDDEISYQSRVTSRRLYPEFPDWLIEVSENEGHNQQGKTVLSLTHEAWVRRS